MTKRLAQILLWALIVPLLSCARSSPAQPDPVTGEAPAVEATAPPTHAGTSTGSTAYAPDAYRLRAGELILAASEDDIPAIFADDTLFVDAEAGSREWQDNELVIGLALQGDARAYPIRLLSSHEIVNDVVGGHPVAITWCPLCFSALVFDRVVERELTFGVSGYLFRNNLVMYDHQTNTLWSQVLAQGIRGALRGEHLNLIPSELTEWGHWKERHPQTQVLSAERLGKQADSLIDPYVSYYVSGIAGLTGASGDDRLAAKELVVGLVVGDQARAYPLPALQRRGFINDELASLPLLLLYDTDLDTVRVYHRAVSGQTLAFQPGDEMGTIRDETTGSTWDVRRGVAVSGPLQGTRLQRLSAPLVYWFAWADFHPDTELVADE